MSATVDDKDFANTMLKAVISELAPNEQKKMAFDEAIERIARLPKKTDRLMEATDAVNQHGFLDKEFKQLIEQRHKQLRKENVANNQVVCGNAIFTMTEEGLTVEDSGSPMWLSAPFTVEASTRTFTNTGWGKLLTWKDADGKPHQLVVQSGDLEREPKEVFSELAANGLRLNGGRKTKDYITTYLNRVTTTKSVRTVDKFGWHGNMYVFRDVTRGTAEESVIFASKRFTEPVHEEAGSFDAWKSEIARYSQDNAFLTFSICAALAGPLLHLVDGEGGGFHLFASTSKGKSTCAAMAASVWGNPIRYVRQWRATSNGLEGIAAMHNDGFLAMDEISQGNPDELSQVAYMLANGRGKVRANRTGDARSTKDWRLVFLSTGEESFTVKCMNAKTKVNAGQEIRFCDLRLDGDATPNGVFEDLHGVASPADLATRLANSTKRHYGHAGPTFVEYLASNFDARKAEAQNQVAEFLADCEANSLGGPARRAAVRFAVLAAAGELAVLAGILPHQPGQCRRSVLQCFRNWLDEFGGAHNKVENAVVDTVTKFFVQHGNSRFEQLPILPGSKPVNNRVGFYRDLDQNGKPIKPSIDEDGNPVHSSTHGARNYYVPAEAFDEVCGGYDPTTVKKVLYDAGILRAKNPRVTQNGKAEKMRYAVKTRLPGLGVVWAIRLCFLPPENG